MGKRSNLGCAMRGERIDSAQSVSLPVRELTRIFTSESIRTSKKNEGDCEWVKEMLKEWHLVVDSSEQVRERPRDYEEQKKCSY